MSTLAALWLLANLLGAAPVPQDKPADPPEVVKALADIGALSKAGKFADAIPLAEMVLAAREKAYGAAHEQVASALNMLGQLAFGAGDYKNAAAWLERALDVREKVYGPVHNGVAASLGSLAQARLRLGDTITTEPLLARALAIREELSGPEHPNLINSLMGLGGLYVTRGDSPRAQPYFERALKITEANFPPESQQVSNALNNLADVIQDSGQLPRALEIRERVLRIREGINPSSLETATALNNVGSVLQEMGNYPAAKPLYRRAIDIYEKTVGLDHPDAARALNHLAIVHLLEKDFAAAGPLYERALRTREQRLGATHPDVANALAGYAIFLHSSGRHNEAFAAQARAIEINEANLSALLEVGSETEKTQYLQQYADAVNITLWMRSTVPASAQASDIALATVVRRKGRVLDAVTRSSEALTRGGANPEAVKQLRDLRAQLARAILGAADAASIRQLQQQIETVERGVAGASAEPRTINMSGGELRKALPAGAAFVDYFRYRPFDATAIRVDKRFGAPKYVACVVTKGAEPAWVELGDAERIDDAVASFRTDLEAKRAGVAATGRRLFDLVMAPVLNKTAGVKVLLLAPDGELNLLPFAALVDGKGRYMVERAELVYLTSARDLVRQPDAGRSSGERIVVANPAFGSAPQGGSAVGTFNELPGAEQEAKAIAQVLPGVHLLTGAAATEQAVKTVSAPQILHLATHGFFLAAGGPAAANSRGIVVPKTSARVHDTSTVRIFDALARSGLALAGANAPPPSGEDGLLTALEVASLNLRGTQLVVLSACETAVGEIASGESVYGLRRAFKLAGAETQVMSLWRVDDAATRDLMAGFYRHLVRGAGRAEALHLVQQELLRGRYRHPYYWAAFIASGERGPITLAKERE